MEPKISRKRNDDDRTVAKSVIGSAAFGRQGCGPLLAAVPLLKMRIKTIVSLKSSPEWRPVHKQNQSHFVREWNKVL